MSVRLIRGTYIAQLNPWFVGDGANLTPYAMTVMLKFDGAGNVRGSLQRRGPGDPIPPADISGTYTLDKNLVFGVFEGRLQLFVGGNADVTIYIVRRTADEIHMNHLDVRDRATGDQNPVVANGILRRERHSALEWFGINLPF